jgi:hypothetical protein
LVNKPGGNNLYYGYDPAGNLTLFGAQNNIYYGYLICPLAPRTESYDTRIAIPWRISAIPFMDLSISLG